MIIQRRSLLLGLASSLAAPAIVRAASLMPVRALISAIFDASTVTWKASYVDGFCFTVTMEEWTTDNLCMALLGVEPNVTVLE